MGGAGRYSGLAGLALLAGCATKPAPPPPRPGPLPPPSAAPAPPPPSAAAQDWRDVSLSPGEWSYRAAAGGSEASYGPADGAAGFVIRCDQAGRQVVLERRPAGSPGGMTLRTSFGLYALPAAAPVTLPASDPILDALAFSRGRFSVEAPGVPILVIPARPEAARVVEDCRS